MSYNLRPQSYQLTSKRPTEVTAVDGIKVQVSEIYRIQSVKMPEYSQFVSSVLSLPANNYTFSIEENVIRRYQAEEKVVATSKKEPEAPQISPNATNNNLAPKKESTYPILIPDGGVLRPSAADVYPRPSSYQENDSSRRVKNEWADFERSHDLFDDLELKSIDDRHELARVLVSTHSESQPNTPSQGDHTKQSGTSSAINALVSEHKKLSLSAETLPIGNQPIGSVPSRLAPTPQAGSLHSSATDLSAERSNGTKQLGLTRSYNSSLSLSASQQTAVNHTVAMGFDKDLVTRMAYLMGTDSDEVLADAVLAHSSLVAAGHPSQDVEKALSLVAGDERKAKCVLEARGYLEQFGFSRENVYSAVAKLVGDKKTLASSPAAANFATSDELRDKLLDMLTTESGGL